MQRLGRAQASTARHLDVQQRHIWPRLQSCRYYLIPLCDSGNHLDILFQAEQGGKRPTHHCLVFRQEHPDHNRTFLLLIVLLWAGSPTNSRKPSLPVDGVKPASSSVTWIGSASMCPPRAVTRSLRPERPLPARPQTVSCSCRGSPSLVTSARTVPFSRVSRMEQSRAAVPDHVGHPLTYCPGKHCIRSWWEHSCSVLDRALDPCRCKHLLCPVQFALQRWLPVPSDGFAHLAQSLACGKLYLADFLHRASGLLLNQASHQFALERNQ